MPELRKPEVETWLGHISAYDRAFKRWQGRTEKILKRYRDENRKSTDSSAKFNILWSNVQTLVPATFSRLPQPDASRRFNDQDPVGRVASMILERALEFEVQHYPDYRSTLKADVYDRFLGGRGTAWIRYEPHFRSVQLQLPPDGTQVTEDAEEPQEELDYECAPCDYVHWKDFGHNVARTWEEVSRVWRKVYMTMPAKIERFGEELAKKIPVDAPPKEKDRENFSEEDKGSWIIEGWNKEDKKAYWFHKSMMEMLDVRDDPLKLTEFFPCPKPLYSTLTSDSLEPVPDFTLYQDQARLLDTLADRIDGLIHALKVRGVYNAAEPSLARLFTEGGNNSLLPVKNWAAFSEKAGLKGAIDLVDLAPIAAALKEAYSAMEQVKGQVYEIFGIADIVRGQSDPNETLGAQKLKGQYVSLRLREMQQEVALFASAILQLKAQIICTQFAPQTIATIASVEQLDDADKQYIEPAMELLLGPRLMDPSSQTPNPLLAFRVEVAADTLVEMDEQQEKENATELLTSIGSFLKQIAEVAQQAPQLVPMLLHLLKFAVRRYKVGKSVEGAIDQAVTQFAQQAQQPPQPNPQVEAEKIKADAIKMKAQSEATITPIRAQAEMKKADAAVAVADRELAAAQIQPQMPMMS